MSQVHQKLESLKVIPVVAIQNADDAGRLADALIAGGLACAEITFRTDAGQQAIRNIGKRSDIYVGAGTVLSVDQVKQAVDAGAKFIVSPGTNPKVVEYCVSNHITITPGIATPTDIEMAMGFGLNVVKFFPAEAFGGLKTLKAISAPYNMIRFIPTGGINETNILEYLKFPKVLACGGSWMVAPELINNGKFDQVTALTAKVMQAIKALG